MPRYDRQCTECGHTEETLEPMNKTSPRTCPACKRRKFVRIATNPAVIFKGKGWPGEDLKKTNNILKRFAKQQEKRNE